MGKLSRKKQRQFVPNHRPNIGRPSYEDDSPLALTEIATSVEVLAGFACADRLAGGDGEVYCKSYYLGQCTVMVTKDRGLWHLSIAHRNRYPTWHEITEARYRLLPDEVTIAMLLPPKSEYINLHKNCFQMVEIPGER